MGVASPGKRRLRAALAVVAVAICALALTSASLGGPGNQSKGVATAYCSPLELDPGGTGLLRLVAAPKSLQIISTKLAPTTKIKTRQRTIKKLSKTTYRFTLAKGKIVRETVRFQVAFGKRNKIMVQKTVSCLVRPAALLYGLSVTLDGNGDGTVISTPTSVACTSATSPCQSDFARGTVVHLAASATPNSDFAGWGGACSGTDECTVTMKAANSVTATFKKKKFTVTVELDGDGLGSVTNGGSEISCGATCSASFDAGTTIKLSAVPDASSRFVRWSGGCTGSASPCALTVSEDTTVTATFGKRGIRLSVSRPGGGQGTITSDPSGITCGSSCSTSYDLNTTVTLTATPAPGNFFDGWGGDCHGVDPTCTVTMDASKNVSAYFTTGVTISVAVNGDTPSGRSQGTGTGRIVSEPAGLDCGPGGAGTCSALFHPGTVVRLSGVPDPGYSLSYWYRCAGPTDVKDGPDPCDALASDLATRTVVAHFS